MPVGCRGPLRVRVMGRASVAARARTTFFRRPGRACRRSRLPPIVPGPAHGAASVTARARTALFRRPGRGGCLLPSGRSTSGPLRTRSGLPAPARCYGSRACLSPTRYGPAPACLPLPVATGAVLACPRPATNPLRLACAPARCYGYGHRACRPDPLRTPAPSCPPPAPATGDGGLACPTRCHGSQGLPAPGPVATGAGACLSPVRYGAAGLPAPNRRAAARLAAWAATPPVRTGPPRRRQSGGPRVQGSRVRCCRRSRRLRSRWPRWW